MKKVVGAAALAAMLGALTIAANSAGSADRPPGVDVADWIAITDHFGLVMVPPPKQPVNIVLTDPTVLLMELRPAVGGYFMARRGNAWARVVVVEPAKGPGDAE
jgi:hypothetical protein